MDEMKESRMAKRTKSLLVVLSILALALVVFTGSALAQTPPNGDDPDTGSWLGQMQEWMDQRHGPGSWGRMIQRMNEVHGPEATGQMLQWMNETGGCHGRGDGANAGPMSGRGFRGMMGRGMMGGAWGGPMGTPPWNSAPESGNGR
jgi:hypothetical protein